MGLLRFLLAVSVILAHAGAFYSFEFVGGRTAVEAFFIISGFYITLILNEKYIKGNDSYKLFITNRLLRLYPFYWIILLLTLICSCFIPYFDSKGYMGNLEEWRTFGSQLNGTSYMFLLFTNFLLFCQDLVYFLGIDLHKSNLFFTQAFYSTSPPLYKFILIPQAWSVGLEIAFYLIAPFIVRRKYTIIVALLSVSLIAKVYGLTHGLNNDPWNYRFFPFEFMYFMMGTLSYIIYKKYIADIELPKYVYPLIYTGVGLFTIVISFLHIGHEGIVYVTVVFLSIPFLFKYTQNIQIDKYIGELSYPIYLSHTDIKFGKNLWHYIK
jgi:peptidoglycan/LPS O-acetylase OafA/YrhL